MIELGHGVRAEVRRIPGETTPDCVYYEHTCNGKPNSPDCVPVKPTWKDGWDLISESPLTLSPSLRCLVCGHHGFIRNGEWQPA